MPKPPPTLPPGTSSTLRGMSDNFSFHSSPEAFITSHILQLQKSQPDILDRRDVIRVKILNRNVAVVSGYQHIREVLIGKEDDDRMRNSRDEYSPDYVAGAAYDALMASFFPGPNLLLADGGTHTEMRKVWDGRMSVCHGDGFKRQVQTVIEKFCIERFGGARPQDVDLYESLKVLSWRIVMKSFMNLDTDHALFGEIQELQEILLRGQFSLLPVSLNARLWKSPRKRGIDAREKLQQIIAKHLSEDAGGIWGKIGREHIYHVTNHVLMMTSSLAVKGMASLLTAFILNLYGFIDDDSTLCERFRNLQARKEQSEQLRSVYLETERLSPPIIGVMRRATRDSILHNDEEEADILVPNGWDVWFYFVGGGRDKQVFGQNSNLFDPRRYLNDHTHEPLGFGMGPKNCLGRDFVRNVALSFAERLLSDGYELHMDDLEAGVKGWLGWTEASIEQWASDMKQLPVQRPAGSISVRVNKG